MRKGKSDRSWRKTRQRKGQKEQKMLTKSKEHLRREPGPEKKNCCQ